MTLALYYITNKSENTIEQYKFSQVFIRSKSSGFDVIVMQTKDDG